MRNLGNEEQGECDRDGHMGVCEGEQQHPVRMERGKGEPKVNTVMSHWLPGFVLWIIQTCC